MADAMLSKKGEMAESSPTKLYTASAITHNVEKGKKPATAKSVKTKQTEQLASTSKETGPSTFNKEALLILREMNSNISKTNQKVDSLSGRVDALYEDNDNYINYDNEYYDYDMESHYDEPELESSSSTTRPFENIEDDGDNVFSEICKGFSKADQCGKSVNQALADLINTTFKEGLSEDNLNDTMKNIFRPENCESLKETRVNTGVWSVLRPQTQTEDSKMRGIQKCIVKAACNITELLDLSSSDLNRQSLKLGTTSLGLLGQANKWLNVRRRELHKKDMDPKLHHLCSSAIPFSDLLYGDSMVKDIKDIQEINKISKNVGAVNRGNRGGRGFRGGRFRGRGRPYPRRGFYGGSRGPSRPKNGQKAEFGRK